MKKICLIDYGSGNQKSMYNLLDYLGYKVKLSNSIFDIEDSTHIILPGVGSYSKLMKNLKEKKILDVLNKEVILKHKPFLGICVGMQILSSYGFEFEKSEGLNWIAGEVHKIDKKNIKLPHIGWNNILITKEDNIVDSLNNMDFYFLHSYVFNLKDNSNSISKTNYGIKFNSIVRKDNIYGAQFHPEKSQESGKIFLKNFLDKIN